MLRQKEIKGSSETTREITKHIPKKFNSNFYHWWIGFLEGDGSFFIRSNNTLGFEISQKTTDAQVLYYIKTNLGFGQVNHNSKIALSRFILSSKSYWNLINILNIGDLRLIKRQTQYKLWIQKAESLAANPSHISLLPKDFWDAPLKLPSWEDSWLSGFIDAEGCFRISYDIRAEKYRLIFQITQDEREILEKIKNLFGSGHRGSIIKDRNTYLLMVSGEKAREQLINYLNLFPLNTQKRIAFMKWNKCHKLLLTLKSKEITPEIRLRTQEEIKKLKESINKYS
jgi:hypothetical protein